MKRSDFIKTALGGIITMSVLKDLSALSESLPVQQHIMPVLFVGHGSPMNAIEDNEFSRNWRNISKKLPKPAAILCISAHWETKGTFVTAMEKPRTIHDFGGFPRALFEVQYPAPGSPAVAKQTKESITSTQVGLDHSWGLDHGTWSILQHLFPKADVPVLQLSLDYTKPPKWHYDLAKELTALRKKGVLIVGSGNMVHNLRMLDFRNFYAKIDWVEEINETFKKHISSRNHSSLINYSSLGNTAQMAIPTPEHYLPLLYILGLQGKNENATFFNDVTTSTISMTSVLIS